MQAGNKGACAVAVTVAGVSARPTRMLLICCHLEAHAHRLQKRNSNVRHILSSLHLQPPASKRGLSQTLLSSFLPSHTSPLRIGRSRSHVRASVIGGGGVGVSGVGGDPPFLAGTWGAAAAHTRGRSLPSHAPVFSSTVAPPHHCEPDLLSRGLGESSEIYSERSHQFPPNNNTQSLVNFSPAMHHGQDGAVRLSTVVMHGSPAHGKHASNSRTCAQHSRRSVSWPESSFSCMATTNPTSPYPHGGPYQSPQQPRSPMLSTIGSLERPRSALASPMHAGSTPVARGGRSNSLARSTSHAGTIVESLQQWDRGRGSGAGDHRDSERGSLSTSKRNSTSLHRFGSVGPLRKQFSASGASTPEKRPDSGLGAHMHTHTHANANASLPSPDARMQRGEEEYLRESCAVDASMHGAHACTSSPMLKERPGTPKKRAAGGGASPVSQQRLQGSPGQLASRGVRTLLRQVSRSADDLKQTFRNVRALVEGGSGNNTNNSHINSNNNSSRGEKPNLSSSTASHSHSAGKHAPFMHGRGYGSGTSISTPVATPAHSRRASRDDSSIADSSELAASPVKVHVIPESCTPEPSDSARAPKATSILRENPIKSLDLRAMPLQLHQDIPTPKLGSSSRSKSFASAAATMHEQDASTQVHRPVVPPRLPSGRLSPLPSLSTTAQKGSGFTDIDEPHASVSAPLPDVASGEPTQQPRHYFKRSPPSHPLPASGKIPKKPVCPQGVSEGVEGGYRDDIASVCSSMHICSPLDSENPSETSESLQRANTLPQQDHDISKVPYIRYSMHLRREKSRSLGAVCESDMHEQDLYRSDSYRGMHTMNRHRYHALASSAPSSRHGADSVRSSDSMDIMHDVVMAPVLMAEGSGVNVSEGSRMEGSGMEVAEWGRQISGMSDVFTIPTGVCHRCFTSSPTY